MSIRNIISKFLTQLCEKNYSEANTSLGQIVEAKTKAKVAKIAKEKETKKLSPAQKKIASAASPFDKITGDDFKALKNKKTAKKPVSAKQAAFLKKIGATKKTSQKGKK
jgi:hypothetical protein